MSESLTSFYNDLKSELAEDKPKVTNTLPLNPTIWRNKVCKERDKLSEECCKHILLDIYCKILPLDQDYVDGHRGQMRNDIDSFLKDKNMSATQYLTSSYGKTNAPLLEFILRSTDLIGTNFYKEADEQLKEAQKNGDVINPPESDVNDKETENQLVDIKTDTEYQTFIDKLKEKTINKIVTDVSKIITDKKEEKEMAFEPKTTAVEESTVSVGIDYINKYLLKESVELDPSMRDEMIGFAIRESTLNQLDIVFRQPYSELKQFSNKIRFGKGVLINESTINYFKENSTGSVVQRYEPLYKETDGNKYDVANHEKVDKNGNKTSMTDTEAKKVLDPEGYKAFQNKKTSINENSEFIKSIGKEIDLYIESCNTEYYIESMSLSKITSTIKNLIAKIKKFIMKILDPLIKKLKGTTKAEDRQAIIDALSEIDIKYGRSEDRVNEKVYNLFASNFTERNGKYYFKGGMILDLYYYKNTLIPQLKEGKIPSNFKLFKNIMGVKVSEICVEDYKNLAMEILDGILLIEEEIAANDSISEKRKKDLLNKLFLISNYINIFLSVVADSMRSYIDPLTEEALLKISDIINMDKFLVELKGRSPNNSSVMKECIIRICMHNGWKFGKGMSRIYIPNPDKGTNDGYKIAYTSKGIADNKREYSIWENIKNSDISKYFIQMKGITSSGIIIKCMKATNIGEISDSDLKAFVKNIDKSTKDRDYTSDIMPKVFGIRFNMLANKSNIGKYNNNYVIIDYANSLYKF